LDFLESDVTFCARRDSCYLAYASASSRALLCGPGDERSRRICGIICTTPLNAHLKSECAISKLSRIAFRRVAQIVLLENARSMLSKALEGLCSFRAEDCGALQETLYAKAFKFFLCMLGRAEDRNGNVISYHSTTN
jgi:hypothetical protein